MERTSEWIFSLEIPSDVTVHAAGVPLFLHKFPLLSKSGYLRHVMLDTGDADKAVILLPDIPGGADGFELAAKFCYGIHFDLTPENAATVRCVAAAISTLHDCENFMSLAEKVKLVSRCIDAIAYLSCKECEGKVVMGSDPHQVVEWWAEDLTELRVDIFQRVLVAMMSRGFKPVALGPILTLYAQKSLCCLDTYGTGARKIEPELAQEKREVVETVTSLLPREKNAVSSSFISMLLRASILVETTMACRVNLERRMGLQLDCAVLDDLLIPTYSSTDDTLFDVDILQRIVTYHLEFEVQGTSVGDKEHIGTLLESCIAEMASDPHLKANPCLSDSEKRRVCSVMNCQKLSIEACAHAAQNERLPVQFVVQVLFHEQQRLHSLVSDKLVFQEIGSRKLSDCECSTDNLPMALEIESLKRENGSLKLENLKLKKRLEDMEKRDLCRSSGSGSSPLRNCTTESPEKPSSLRRKSFINSMSKRLGWFYPFVPIGPTPAIGNVMHGNAKACSRPRRTRRHSLS